MISLAELKPKQSGIVAKLEGGHSFKCKLEALNIRVGKKIRKVSKTPLRGPTVIEVDHAKIAIGFGMVKKIFVEIEK